MPEDYFFSGLTLLELAYSLLLILVPIGRCVIAEVAMTTDHTLMENNSAKKIQKWWRAKLEKDQNVADKTRQLAESKYLSQITLQNDLLISKLEKLRKEKTQDAIRYERILNMPARDVNDFMKKEINNEIKRGESRFGTEDDSKKQHAAAKIIQKTFQNYYKRRIAEKYLRYLAIIKPSKRVEYLAHINGQLSNKKTVIAIPLEEIRTKLHLHKVQRNQDAENFARRQSSIRAINQASMSIALASLELVKTANLNVSTPLINYKAQKAHAEEIEKIEEIKWKICKNL